ncbi:MAG: TIGR03118 family protein, partial [Actinomycetes bacterium]
MVVALGLVAGVVALAPVAPAAASHSANGYHQTNLVSDLPGLAQLTDPDLVNPWGLAAGPTTPAWVADNGTGKATIYPGFVGGSPITKAPLVVNIPGGAPTGQVFNPTAGFVVRSGAASGPALFLFDSEAGL